MTRSPPGTRADYGALRPMQTRWIDNDAYGHMNNATYYALFDTAVTDWQRAQGLAVTGPDALRLLVVESGCRYHAEAGYPDTIHAGLRLGHLGRSSFRTEVGLFRNDEDIACAEGFFTQVHVGPDGPAPMPEALRAALATLPGGS